MYIILHQSVYQHRRKNKVRHTPKPSCLIFSLPTKSMVPARHSSAQTWAPMQPPRLTPADGQRADGQTKKSRAHGRVFPPCLLSIITLFNIAPRLNKNTHPSVRNLAAYTSELNGLTHHHKRIVDTILCDCRKTQGRSAFELTHGQACCLTSEIGAWFPLSVIEGAENGRAKAALAYTVCLFSLCHDGLHGGEGGEGLSSSSRSYTPFDTKTLLHRGCFPGPSHHQLR